MAEFVDLCCGNAHNCRHLDKSCAMRYDVLRDKYEPGTGKPWPFTDCAGPLTDCDMEDAAGVEASSQQVSALPHAHAGEKEKNK